MAKVYFREEARLKNSTQRTFYPLPDPHPPLPTSPHCHMFWGKHNSPGTNHHPCVEKLQPACCLVTEKRNRKGKIRATSPFIYM